MNIQQSYSASALPVMNALPWPNGFSAVDVWEQRTAPNEYERLDRLMGLALLNSSIHNRLIVQHDPSLLDALDLSDDTRHWLTTIQANSLTEFAPIVAASNPYRGWSASKAA